MSPGTTFLLSYILLSHSYHKFWNHREFQVLRNDCSDTTVSALNTFCLTHQVMFPLTQQRNPCQRQIRACTHGTKIQTVSFLTNCHLTPELSWEQPLFTHQASLLCYISGIHNQNKKGRCSSFRRTLFIKRHTLFLLNAAVIRPWQAPCSEGKTFIIYGIFINV